LSLGKRINASWAAKYPFTKEAKEYIRLVAPPLEEFREEDLKHVLKYAFERAIGSIKGRVLVSWRFGEDELIATSFPLALAMVKATKNPFLYAKFANGEAKRAYILLRNELPENVIHIAREFGLRVNYVGDGEYRIHFMDYLKIASKMASKQWKLVNNLLEGGFVKIDQRRISRIISESIRQYIIDRLIEEGEIAEEGVISYSKKLLEMFKKRINGKYKIEEVINKSFESFPPCMRRIYEMVISGGNPPHMARFALTAFLLRIGYKIDEVFKLFIRTSDFNERIARYQVEHIAGERGGRKKYMVPSCEKMRVYNLCFPDERCKRIKNPVNYPLIKEKDERKL